MLYFILVNYEERQLKMIENNEDKWIGIEDAGTMSRKSTN